MECYRRAMIGEQTFEGRRENLCQANKLSRTYATLLESLNRHRGKGAQKVTVEHVHVHEGGQAICTSAAIGPTVVHIGTDTVGSIRAFGCASKRPQLIVRLACTGHAATGRGTWGFNRKIEAQRVGDALHLPNKASKGKNGGRTVWLRAELRDALVATTDRPRAAWPQYRPGCSAVWLTAKCVRPALERRAIHPLCVLPPRG
jgi:hypothetical protein